MQITLHKIPTTVQPKEKRKDTNDSSQPIKQPWNWRTCAGSRRQARVRSNPFLAYGLRNPAHNDPFLSATSSEFSEHLLDLLLFFLFLFKQRAPLVMKRGYPYRGKLLSDDLGPINQYQQVLVQESLQSRILADPK